MKKYIPIILLTLIFTGCEDILDKPDPSTINPEIWDNEQAATLFLNKLYDANMPTFGGNANRSDESPGGDEYMYGTLTTASVGDYSLATYRKIRDINIGIHEALNGNMPEEGKNRILGQLYFMRAWRYWDLVDLYGGVPMVLKPLDPYNDDLDDPRNKTSECIDIIVADLDNAIAMLPSSWSSGERGRITRGAAAALKGRVLLFWASPQFNPDNKNERWERAYEANKAAKDTLEKDGYALHPHFDEIFLDEGNAEFIFGRLYDFNADKVHGWDNSVRPVDAGLTGGTSNNPTWNLVKAFPMSNGLSITDPSSGYDSVYFWKNRDPRFYATIGYNGCKWEFTGLPANRVQWHYYYYQNIQGTLYQVPVETPRTTTTGFYCRKAVNPDISKELCNQVGTDWPEIRMAEVLLSLAECANEVGKTQEAYNELIAIRDRAGITAGSNGLYGLKQGMDKNEMREAVMLERQIELAFENKRSWDLRRRNWFDEKLNGTRRYGLKTILKPLPDTTYAYTAAWFLTVRDTINLDKDYDKYFTAELWVKDEANTINFPQPLYNFFAIPPDMLDRSPAVEQTLLWGGAFDPLAE